jgi:uncharacterized delta-60 repeat protein
VPGGGAVARFNTDGSLDTTFSSAGLDIIFSSNGPSLGFISNLSIQTDGKILVTGQNGQSPQVGLVARLNADGSMDQTFNAKPGPTVIDLVLEQRDGRVLVGGMGLVRLNADGSLDTTWGTPSPAFNNGTPTGMALQANGRLLVTASGSSTFTGTPTFIVDRYNINGTADTTFGTGGAVTVSFPGVSPGGGGSEQASNVLVQPDGKIVAVGIVRPDAGGAFDAQFALARLNPNGALDTTFGSGGQVINNFGASSNSVPAGAVLQVDGKIVVAGTTAIVTTPISENVPTHIALARYLGDSASNASASQRFVAQIYLDLLLRTADSGGLLGWSGLIDQGLETPAQVALSIEGSQEYQALFLQQLYGMYLRRSVDPIGLGGWTNFLANGGTEDQLRALLLGSAEYFADAGNNGAFLTAVYRDVLSRPVDSFGVQAWGQALASGTSRTTVASDIISSPEGASDEVQALYFSFLHRSADSFGLQQFTQDLQQGVPVEEIVAAIVGSSEYARTRI